MISQAEVQRWHNAIVRDEWTAKYELDQLAKRDPDHFVQLAQHLIQDRLPLVQRIALEKLWERGNPIDAAACASVLASSDDEALRSVAFEVLRAVKPPEAVPRLMTLAEHGSADALALLQAADLVGTAEHQAHLLQLAHRYALAEDEDLRREAHGILATRLSLAQWEDLELEAARRFVDEEAIAALGRRATRRVLPELRLLLSRLGPGYVESATLASAIAAMEARNDAEQPPTSSPDVPDSTS